MGGLARRRGVTARACTCSPSVFVSFGEQRRKVGELRKGWRKSDLEPFEQRLAEAREGLRSGRPLAPAKVPTLVEFAEGWFDELYAAAEGGRISKLTHNSYESIWHNHLREAFGTCPLPAIDGAMIRRYVAAKLADGLAPVTVNGTLTPLSAMLTDAVAEGLIAANPARQPRRARHRGSGRKALYADAKRETPKHLEPDEALAVLAVTAPGQPREMVLATLTTGFRRGELLGLRWEDIRWGDRRIDLRGQLQDREFVGCKCGSEREVVLFSGLAGELGRRRRAEGYVFVAPDGRPWPNGAPERTFLRAAYERAGLRRPRQMWHALRHTYASVLAAGGVRRDVIEQLMGHAAKGTTSLYTHLFRDAFDGVEEALAAVFAGVSLEDGVPGCVPGASLDAELRTDHNGRPRSTGGGERPANGAKAQ